MKIPAHIQILIDKYLDGSASEPEKIIVNDWYRSFTDDQVEIISDKLIDLKALELRIKGRLDKTIGKHTGKHKSQITYWRVWSAAAAILLLIGSAVYFFTGNNKVDKGQQNIVDQQKTIVPGKIIPGGNKAILILADGSEIVLDSAANGIISQQGNIKIDKLNNGQLVYTINGKQVTENDEAFYNTISTPRGGQYKVTLADGTKVWLNAASSIRFPILFTGVERSVSITGEVYLEVAKNKEKPFIVHTATAAIEVLGTHFNVNAYDDEPSTKTTLLEGLVRISATGTDAKKDEKLLRPGQQAILYKSGQLNIVKNTDVDEAVAWINGRFQFKSADMETILRQISRWYDADIKYAGKIDLHFTGQFPRSEDVKKVFETLAMTGEIQSKIDGKIIYVSAK